MVNGRTMTVSPAAQLRVNIQVANRSSFILFAIKSPAGCSLALIDIV